MYKKILLTLSCILLSKAALGAPATPAAAEAVEKTPAEAQDKDKENKLVIENAWARPSLLPSNNSAVYLSIRNTTDYDIVLIGASAIDVANNVELHKSFVDEKGVTKMTSIDKIVIPAYNSTIKLEPGGTHIMLFDLKNTLKVGDKFNMRLSFEGMDQQTVEVLVKSAP